MVWGLIWDAFCNAVLITGLVVVMMMIIESVNINSRGRALSWMRRSHAGQILLSAGLGAVPGCLGGYATVSLYAHGVVSFGALVAMLIATAGDESFVMLALMPLDAAAIFAGLFVLAVVVGFLVDWLWKKPPMAADTCNVHCSEHDEQEESLKAARSERHLSSERLIMFIGVLLFITVLISGVFEGDSPVEEASSGGINLLNEEWMYWLFGAFSLIVLAVLIWGNDHFVREHLWEHIVKRHLSSIFGWSFGVLLAVGVLMAFWDVSAWINSNTALMIVLAALVGLIPESGPHMVFVTMYAGGLLPMPVLLASCISQDGHAALPLLSESKKTFLYAKLINFALALAVGFASLLIL